VGPRRTPRNIDVYGYNLVHATDCGIRSFPKDAATTSAGTDRHYDTRFGCRLVRPLKRDFHIAGYGTCHEEDISVPRACDEVNPIAFEITKGIRRRGDLQLTGVAAAGIDLAHVQRTTKPVSYAAAQVSRRLLKASTLLSLDSTEVGATRSVHVERRSLCELFPTVCGDLDVVCRGNRLFGT
jgi:hypothetical protein